jgi:hypothetical protein
MFLGPRVSLTRPVLPLFLHKPFVPVTDVFVRDEDLVIRVELPGIDPGTDVTVSVEEGHLVIRGERKQEEPKEEAYYRIEAAYGTLPSHPRGDRVRPDRGPVRRWRAAGDRACGREGGGASEGEDHPDHDGSAGNGGQGCLAGGGHTPILGEGPRDGSPVAFPFH